MLDELHALREQARQAASRGALEEATSLLVTAAQQTHVAEQDYASVLRPLAEVLMRRGDARSALTVEWYLAQAPGGTWNGARALLPRVPPVDRARTLAASGAKGAMEQAAREMEDAGRVAGAAIFREKAGDWQGARALWSRLGQVTGDTGEGAYNAALVQFNLARCARSCGDARQAREATVAAVRLLEEGADHFESVGQRERAFDCFQVLVQIGRESRTFEDVLEGFVNCIRILREDHLKYFALSYFDEALRAARDGEELSAAATLAREAAEYARSVGFARESAHYTLLQASLWVDVAQQQTARGTPPEIAENAYLAAILAYGEVGQFARVGQHYEELARMNLEPSRKAHYARASRRYRGVKDEPLDAGPVPAQYRQESQFPEVWHVDLVEWEQQGSASEACAEVLLETRWHDLVRRRAMLGRLTAFTVEAHSGPSNPGAQAARVRLCEQLAQLQIYAVLSPLERLYERGDRPVKMAVLASLRTLFFKRSFVTLRAALRESDPGLVEQAAKAVESLYFAHAFDPLARIVRESPAPIVRASAVRGLAKVDSLEAAEFLLGLLEHGAPADRSATVAALKAARGTRFVELARAHMASAPPQMQIALREILDARGYPRAS